MDARTILRLSGFCPGQTGGPVPEETFTRSHLSWLSIINHPVSASSIHYDPWHPLCSICVPDSQIFLQSLQIFFGLLLGMASSTSYSIRFSKLHCICLTIKMASLVPLPFINPNCLSSICVSILYRF